MHFLGMSCVRTLTPLYFWDDLIERRDLDAIAAFLRKLSHADELYTRGCFAMAAHRVSLKRFKTPRHPCVTYWKNQTMFQEGLRSLYVLVTQQRMCLHQEDACDMFMLSELLRVPWVLDTAMMWIDQSDMSDWMFLHMLKRNRFTPRDTRRLCRCVLVITL